MLPKSMHRTGYMCAKSLKPCPTLCDPIDGSPPGSSVPGILQARILEWVAISFFNPCMGPHRWQPTRLLHPWDSPGKNTGVGCHFLLQFMKEKSESEVAQWCLTLCNPTDCSMLDSSVHGILQAKILEWVAVSFSRGSSRPRD